MESAVYRSNIIEVIYPFIKWEILDAKAKLTSRENLTAHLS